MRLVCISDTHSRHEKMLPIPDGDALIHAGDLTGSGSIPKGFEAIEWLGSLPHSYKLLIAGNHDFCFEDYGPWMREQCENCGVIYLEDESTVINGVKFHGSPWTPFFRNMSFNAHPDLMAKKMALVPNDTNVLITHGPPLGIFDWIPDLGERVGSFELAKTIDRLPNLKAHIFGHIHEGYGFGVRESDGIKFANASTCTERYKPTNPPIIIDLGVEF
ncbi:Predicted phosphoesterase [Marinobacter persicus]|uniref:Predicted phosphoesterase n=1 Tax=Marinobacter persicus TaxID=930118 RepID=A0A1I3WS55_9GAMM|nr:metallophosphatase domain-containing protein [Marinobacter persicus]SFK10033.1 Predicted phosphoesterase [Marinobacter persicus]